MQHHFDFTLPVLGAIGTAVSEATGQPYWLSCTIGGLTALYVAAKLVILIRNEIKGKKSKDESVD